MVQKDAFAWGRCAARGRFCHHGWKNICGDIRLRELELGWGSSCDRGIGVARYDAKNPPREAGWFYSALTLLQIRMAARPAAKQTIAPMPMLFQSGNTAGMEPMTKPRMAE